MSKRILIGLSVIAAVAAIVVGATTAYFSDVETSSGNTFTAGTMDLKLNNGDTNVIMFTVENVKPGDQGSAEVNLKNAGDLDGFLDITFSNIVDNDPSLTEPEEQDGDNTQGVGKGELADNLHILAYIDEDNDDTYDANNGDTLVYDGLAVNINEKGLSDHSFSSGEAKPFRIEWSVGTDVGNEIQNDVAGFDITFELAQTAGQ